MNKIHRIEISVALGLIVSIVVSVVSFASECKNIRKDVIRLHILANSDSEADQQVKLAVRDALLESGGKIFSGTADKDNAVKYLEADKEKLIETANRVLKENGFDYESEVYLVKEYFNTRTYEDFTMPAGEYLALKIILGEGKGHNWWCVMFPPLCLPAATDKANLNAVFTENEVNVIEGTEKYEIRFKIVEIIERIKDKLT